MSATVVLLSVALFLLAGLLEIGGGYLVWQWLREDAGAWVGLAGGLVLMLYGVVPTFQPAHFGRVYAAYGGVFVVASLLWGWGGGRPGARSPRRGGRRGLPGGSRGDHVLAALTAPAIRPSTYTNNHVIP